MLLDLDIHRIKLFILIVLIIRALLSVRVQGIIFRDGPSSFFFLILQSKTGNGKY